MHPLRAYLHRFVPMLTDADWQPLAQALRPRHLGYGLKYATGFRDTHLGRVGAEQPEAAAH